MSQKNSKKECEVLWAKNKYYVLSKSHKVYLEIREYLKEKEVEVAFLHEKIAQVREIEESPKDFCRSPCVGLFQKTSERSGKTRLIDDTRSL